VRLNVDLVDTGVLSSHPKPSVEQETSKVCQKGLVRRLGDQICTIVTVGLELTATAALLQLGRLRIPMSNVPKDALGQDQLC
jgi:hypothetical protein